MKNHVIRLNEISAASRRAIIFSGCMVTICAMGNSCERGKSGKSPDESSENSLPSVRPRKPITSRLRVESSIYLVSLPESLRTLARSDLPGAIDTAKSLSGVERENALEALLMAASLDNPEFVSRELLTAGLPVPKMRKLSLYLVSIWKDGNAALHWADQNIKGINRGMVIGSVLERLGRECPPAAFTYVENMGPGKSQDEAFSRFVASLASKDAIGALDFTLQISDKKRSRLGTELVCNRWANSDPGAAQAYLEKSDGGETYFGMSLALSYQKIQQDGPVPTIKWARTLPGPAADLAIKSSILQWGCIDREATAAFLETASPDDQKAVCPQFASDWTERDPVAAGKWVAGRQSTVAQREVVAEVMRTWMRKSPLEASKWLGDLPAGSARDAGIVILVRNEMFNDMTGTFRWLEEIADPGLKEKQMNIFLSLIENRNLETSK